MNLRYEIEETTNAVKVFDGDSTVPFLYQPNYPGGGSWADSKDAENWAKLYINSIVDEAAPFAPNNPGEPGDPKPTQEELAAMKAAVESRLANKSVTP